MTRLRSPAAYASLGSLLLHAGIAAWLLTRPVPDAEREDVQPIEFALYEPPSTAALAPEHAPSAEDGQPAPDTRAKSPRKTPARSAEAQPRVASVPSVTVSPPDAPATEAAPAAPASHVSGPSQAGALAVTRAPARFDISPLAAALTMRDALGVEGSCAALRNSDAGCSQGAGKPPSAPALATGPRIAAGSRDELDLKHEADGSLSYDSPAFVARIAPDGRVHFEDKIQDLNTLVERHLVGAQINTSAKRRFIESTAALREELATRSEARNQVTAAAALRAKLASVLASGTLSLAQKRSALFELWDSCASDESGNAAQAAIENFIRSRLPADSPLAYSRAELAQLNKRRVSRRVFDPYGAVDAGALPS